jgi:hypothetical protein
MKIKSVTKRSSESGELEAVALRDPLELKKGDRLHVHGSVLTATC